MELDKQVCSLELAKRLNELGVRQESTFIWAMMKLPDRWQVAFINRIGFTFWNGAAVATHRLDEFEHYSAFTVAELGEMLPRYCEVTFKNRAQDRKKVRWNCDNQFNETEEATEADARAQMLIYLLENHLIEI